MDNYNLEQALAEIQKLNDKLLDTNIALDKKPTVADFMAVVKHTTAKVLPFYDSHDLSLFRILIIEKQSIVVKKKIMIISPIW